MNFRTVMRYFYFWCEAEFDCQKLQNVLDILNINNLILQISISIFFRINMVIFFFNIKS